MVKRDDARRFLSNVPEDKVFWASNGSVLRNLGELEQALEHMDDGTYKCHANKEKNDFSNWIKDVVGDNYLADRISNARNKGSAHKKVKERVRTLGKVAG